MIIRSLIATTIAAIVTAGFVLAIGLTVSPAAPIKFSDFAANHILKSTIEGSNGITLAEIVACDCAHSNIESRSTRTGAGAVAPHAGIRFYLLRKKNMAGTKSKEEVSVIRPPSHWLMAKTRYHI